MMSHTSIGCAVQYRLCGFHKAVEYPDKWLAPCAGSAAGPTTEAQGGSAGSCSACVGAASTGVACGAGAGPEPCREVPAPAPGVPLAHARKLRPVSSYLLLHNKHAGLLCRNLSSSPGGWLR